VPRRDERRRADTGPTTIEAGAGVNAHRNISQRQMLRTNPSVVFAVVASALLAGCAGPSAPSLQLVYAGPSSAVESQYGTANSLAAVSREPNTVTVPLPLAIPSGTEKFATGNLLSERKGAVSKVGKPYQVAGRWYTPKHEPGFSKTGVASWYGREFHGRKTANGEIFNSRRLTAAHPTLPLPSLVEVTNIANGRKIIVRVNDRGPYAHGRLIDVSQATAEQLGFINKGFTQVHVRYLGPAPLGGEPVATARRSTAKDAAVTE
jgi:rare lipoprotein A (peptidoglycan hydrolase)